MEVACATVPSNKQQWTYIYDSPQAEARLRRARPGRRLPDGNRGQPQGPAPDSDSSRSGTDGDGAASSIPAVFLGRDRGSVTAPDHGKFGTLAPESPILPVGGCQASSHTWSVAERAHAQLRPASRSVTVITRKAPPTGSRHPVL